MRKGSFSLPLGESVQLRTGRHGPRADAWVVFGTLPKRVSCSFRKLSGDWANRADMRDIEKCDTWNGEWDALRSNNEGFKVWYVGNKRLAQ